MYKSNKGVSIDMDALRSSNEEIVAVSNDRIIKKPNGFKGKTHTKEARERISKANKENPSRKKTVCDADRGKIRDLYNSGVSGTKLAKQFNISRTTLYRYLLE